MDIKCWLSHSSCNPDGYKFTKIKLKFDFSFESFIAETHDLDPSRRFTVKNIITGRLLLSVPSDDQKSHSNVPSMLISPKSQDRPMFSSVKRQSSVRRTIIVERKPVRISVTRKCPLVETKCQTVLFCCTTFVFELLDGPRVSLNRQTSYKIEIGVPTKISQPNEECNRKIKFLNEGLMCLTS